MYGICRKDLEKTKKIAKKFVRYQEGAELYIWHRQEKICGAESCGKVNHRDVQTGNYSHVIASDFSTGCKG